MMLSATTMATVIVLLASCTAPSSAYNGIWHWDVVNMNSVSGNDLRDPGVWVHGKVASMDECMTACAANASCTSCDFAAVFNDDSEAVFDPCEMHHEHTCPLDLCFYDAQAYTCRLLQKKMVCDYTDLCYFRSDSKWDLKPNGGCNHTAARKVDGPPPPPPSPPPPPPPVSPVLGYQPNIVFILTDDQDQKLGPTDYSWLGSLEAMPSLRSNLMTQGAMFKNFFVNTPICCPSRTESFTGRYYHNVGPPNVANGNCMHVDTSPVAGVNTGLFGLLKRAGYNTGIFGKVTNDQGNILKLASNADSWTYIDSPVDYNSYDGLPYWRKFPNGSFHTETIDAKNPVYGTTYQSSQIGNRSLSWLDAAANEPLPFFMYLGPHAPHYPAEPAPWYQNAFRDIGAPVTPNYNVSSPDKTNHIRQNPPLTALAKCWEDRHMRDRWSSLLSVDDIITALFDKLTTLNKLEKTFIFYSSDHGYKLGQWRVGTSKEHPYETDIHVPFLVRGPGIAADSVLYQVTGNVDILPTIIDLAAGKDYIPSEVDGRSMIPFLITNTSASTAVASHDAVPWRDHFIIEYKSVGTYYNDHSTCWAPQGQCGGAGMPTGPTGKVKGCVEAKEVGTGNCYFVDSTFSNSWRELRIINSTMNISYIEYDPAFEFVTNSSSGEGLQYYELYDVSEDVYQVKNLYPTATADLKTALHQQLAAYFQCASGQCP